MTTTQPRRRAGTPAGQRLGDVRCPVCRTVTGKTVVEREDGYPRTVAVLNDNASGRPDGYRCLGHARTLAQRQLESALALLDYDPSGLVRGE